MKHTDHFPAGTEIVALVALCADELDLVCGNLGVLDGLRLDTRHTGTGPERLTALLRAYGFALRLEAGALRIEQHE
jgi:hypothetical protein